MTNQRMEQLFQDTAYVREGGSPEEKRAAAYLVARCGDFGAQATQVPFEVDVTDIQEASLTVDGLTIPCKGYRLCGSGEVEAPLYYLRATDSYSLSLCKGKIVLLDGYLGYWRYHDILEAGAVGFITYDGSVNYVDRDIDQRELRPYVVGEKAKLLGVNINVKDAVALIERGGGTARLVIRQEESKGTSQNVRLDLPGEIEDTIVFTAHYDSTSLSQGAYDNMSGSVGLLAMAEYFSQHPHRYSLRFLWCGSEERGLLGAKAYCAAEEEELTKTVLCINLDMIGCTMGKFIACCTTEKDMVSYLSYMGREYGFPVSSYHDVYSSDSTPFADKGIPAVSFARISPREAATIHNRYDTAVLVRIEQMQADIAFITAFAERMANAKCCPVSKTMPEEMKGKLDEYLCRKRKK
ncbi:MAG: Zn-dependent exopeptidase M28 [Ruminococcaceae bacterium]|nr:Zn-dependent exopeptidase M28 [Oscillospiraceae bacterium]